MLIYSVYIYYVLKKGKKNILLYRRICCIEIFYRFAGHETSQCVIADVTWYGEREDGSANSCREQLQNQLFHSDVYRYREKTVREKERKDESGRTRYW